MILLKYGTGGVSPLLLSPFYFLPFLMKVVTRSAVVQHQTRLAGDVAIRSLRYFEGYFDVPFPLPKIDVIAVPENSFSAMENWGLITFRCGV